MVDGPCADARPRPAGSLRTPAIPAAYLQSV